jgi:hypothetical protein
LTIIEADQPKASETVQAAKKIFAGLAKGVTKMGAGMVDAGEVANELINSLPGNESISTEVTVSDLRRELGKAIDQYINLSSDRKGFLVFINDLDRIDPVVAVNIFEESTLQKGDVFEKISPLSSLSVGRNPRSMKRLSNILSITKKKT